MTLPTVTLPWPDSRLSPNKRSRHRWLTDVRTIARNTGYFAVKQVGLSVPDRTPLHLFITLYPPDNRRRDGDNVISSLKSVFDGMFDALGVDDSNVRLTTYGFGRKVDGGQVEIKIEIMKPERRKE